MRKTILMGAAASLALALGACGEKAAEAPAEAAPAAEPAALQVLRDAADRP